MKQNLEKEKRDLEEKKAEIHREAKEEKEKGGTEKKGIHFFSFFILRPSPFQVVVVAAFNQSKLSWYFRMNSNSS